MNRLAAILAAVAVVWCALLTRHEGDQPWTVEHHLHATATATLPSNGYAYLDRADVESRLWQLPCVSYVVESAFSYEANLVGGSSPVADQDSITCGRYGYPVHLPGHKWDVWSLVGTVCVQGSGWVAELIAPNGGRVSLLHLAHVYGPTPYAVCQPYVGATPPGVDDATGLAVLGSPHRVALPTAVVYHGGDVIGTNGYPTDPRYGNGIADASNSQLCVLTDLPGQNLLLWLAEGNDYAKPKPAPFKRKLWDSWRVKHHKSVISPYLANHHLRRAAVLWYHGHESAGGIVSPPQTVRPKHGRAYVTTRFQFSRLWLWPGTSWVKWQSVTPIR